MKQYRPGLSATLALLLAAILGAGCGSDVTAPTHQGRLRLTTVPAGASIALDGRIMNVVTPYTFGSLSVGTHTVLLGNLPGYQDTTLQVTLAADVLTQRDVTLAVELPSYLLPDSPESVLANIRTAFMRRDPAGYVGTLAPDYVFRLQPSDITVGQPDSLVRSEEVSFVEHLLEQGLPALSLPPATQVALQLTVLSQFPDNRVGRSGWMKYVVQTDLTVGFGTLIPLRIRGPAWLYFRPGAPSPGAPARGATQAWVLAEWADQPLSSSSGSPGRGPLAASVNTWGKLRLLYR